MFELVGTTWSTGADRGLGSSPGGFEVGELLLDGVLAHAGDVPLMEIPDDEAPAEAFAIVG
jgi:hypothetical protein